MTKTCEKERKKKGKTSDILITFRIRKHYENVKNDPWVM